MGKRIQVKMCLNSHVRVILQQQSYQVQVYNEYTWTPIHVYIYVNMKASSFTHMITEICFQHQLVQIYLC